MKKCAVLLFFVFVAVVSYAQNEAYLIPHKIFIGDPATLIIPLNSAAGIKSQTDNIILTPLSYNFPSHPDIDFHKIALEQSAGGKRLTIEFTAFVPGILEFPVIEIGDISLSGLTVTVNSILDNHSSPSLSSPAASLAMPGTAFMLYGTITGIILIILLTIWFVLKGRTVINNIREKLKRWRLFSLMKKTERRLLKAVQNGENSRFILDKLSEQFRIFLSDLTGKNCRTMTAGEFEKLSLRAVLPNITEHNDLPLSFLHDFFRDCDDLRFSGVDAASVDILYLLACLRRFITAAENAGRENIKKEELAA